MGTHQHAEARIILPLEGEFETSHGSRCLTVGETAALHRPAHGQHYDCYRSPVICVTIAMNSEHEALVKPEQAPYTIVDDDMRHLAHGISCEMTAQDAAAELILQGLAAQAVWIVLHRRPLPRFGRSSWIRPVRELLEAHYTDPPTLAELGAFVHRDSAYVAATFKHVYGTSVGAYVRMLRLRQARKLIEADPQGNLSQIAQQCGFADQSHFSRNFKRMFSMTPGQYCRRH